MSRIAHTIRRMIGLVLVAAACALLCLPAWAEPSNYRTSLTRRSLANGFEKSSIVVLKPDPGPGREVVARRLLSKLDGSLGRRLVATDLSEPQNSNRILSYIGENSALEVYGDGTRFRFRGDIDNAKGIESISTGKLSDADLESLGRAFIAKALGDFVKSDRDNSITFLGTRYLRSGATDLNGRIEDKVIANIAIFGREVDGIPVVGSGSKIVVWFTNDRNPIAFDVDWPRYRATEENQRILSRERLQARVEATTIASIESLDAKVSRFECGYVDLGATRRENFIQSGCMVAYDGRSKPLNAAGETVAWASAEFVPAGVNVLEDSRWPLANYIVREGEPKPGDFESIDLITEDDPGSPPSNGEALNKE